MSAKSFSIDDRTLIEIISDAENKLESKLSGITSSSGLMDFIVDMSNMWSSTSFPIKGEDSFEGDTAKHYIFKNIMKLCKLELARRRVLLETKDKRQYLASVIRTNKLLTEREAKISFWARKRY